MYAHRAKEWGQLIKAFLTFARHLTMMPVIMALKAIKANNKIGFLH